MADNGSSPGIACTVNARSGGFADCLRHPRDRRKQATGRAASYSEAQEPFTIGFSLCHESLDSMGRIRPMAWRDKGASA